MGDREVIERIKQVERDVAKEGRKKLNGIVDVATHLKDPSPVVVLQAVHTLRDVFSGLISKNDLGLALPPLPAQSTAQAKYRAWLQARYVHFTHALVQLVQREEDAIQVAAFDTAMRLLQCECDSARKRAPREWNRELFVALVSHCVNNQHFGERLRQRLVSQANEHSDILLRTLQALLHVVKESKAASLVVDEEQFGDNVFSVLWEIDVPTTPEEVAPARLNEIQRVVDVQKCEKDLQLCQSRGSRRKKRKLLHAASDLEGRGSEYNREMLQLVIKHAFTEAWMALLDEGRLSTGTVRTLLQGMHTRILPNIHNPLRLSDFVVACYSHGGVISVLSLDALFTLMAKHNLEYPEFYTRLYQLFDADLLHTKYRAHFFKLADRFLSSSHLPAYLVAAFAKRTCQLCLQAPPAGCQLALAFVHNLLNRHRSCMCLIHRTEGASDAMAEDPFVSGEKDPAKANAMQSSLWELQLLFEHANPDVAQQAKTFTDPFPLNPLKLSDLENLGYNAAFDKDANRKTKHFPMAYQPCDAVFARDAAMKHWVFN